MVFAGPRDKGPGPNSPGARWPREETREAQGRRKKSTGEARMGPGKAHPGPGRDQGSPGAVRVWLKILTIQLTILNSGSPRDLFWGSTQTPQSQNYDQGDSPKQNGCPQINPIKTMGSTRSVSSLSCRRLSTNRVTTKEAHH